jgi:hypothetical protein
LLCIAVAFVAAPAWAADGVLEIHQSCAEGAGCFAGDAPGFPVTIGGSAGRSYRLTGDLLVSSVDTTAIQIAAQVSGVAIDLGGFGIRGPVTCSGIPLACSGAGEGIGIEGAGSGVIVRNGVIAGMGSSGLVLGSTDGGCVVEDLVARENSGHGISIGRSGRVRGATTTQNAAHGISVGPGSVVTSSVTRANGLHGIVGGPGSVISGNAALENGAAGIAAGGLQPGNLAAAGNVLWRNGAYGFAGFDGSLALDNTAVGNASYGIGCFAGCRLHGNALRENVGFGVSAGPGSSYSESAFTGNTAGALSGLAENRGGNLCVGVGVGSATCP